MDQYWIDVRSEILIPILTQEHHHAGLCVETLQLKAFCCGEVHRLGKHDEGGRVTDLFENTDGVIGVGRAMPVGIAEGDMSLSRECAHAVCAMADIVGIQAREEKPISYQDRARKLFVALGDRYQELAPDKRAEEEARLFEQMLPYFLEQEGLPKGSGSFQLADAHNAIVRNYDHPEFHQRLMAYLMSEEAEARKVDHTKLLDLSIKAREFDANGVRRRGFELIKKGKAEQSPELQQQGMQQVSEARATFGAVLHHWERVQDLGSQGRVLYELAQIALDTKDFHSAADLQARSAFVYEGLGETVEALIARIKQCQAQLKGKTEAPASILSRLEALVTAIRPLAAEKKTNAREWLGNGLLHLAEAQEAAGQIAAAIESLQEILSNTDVQSSAIAKETSALAREEIGRLTA